MLSLASFWSSINGLIQGTFFEVMVCLSVGMKMFYLRDFLNDMDWFSIGN